MTRQAERGEANKECQNGAGRLNLREHIEGFVAKIAASFLAAGVLRFVDLIRPNQTQAYLSPLGKLPQNKLKTMLGRKSRVGFRPNQREYP